MSVAPALPALGAAALYYATKFGWAVFPLHSARAGVCSCGAPDCGNVAKHPRARRGFRDASKDPAVIAKWWDEWPDANIGIALGWASGVVVLDVDPRNGGDESLERLESEYGPLPNTVESMTGGGGRHIFFNTPADNPRKRKVRAGLDFQADGGYVVAPPSVHASGRAYAWEASSRPDEMAPAELPEWLRELVRKRPALVQSAPVTECATHPLADRIKRASAYLRTIPGAVSGEGGHDKTFEAACLIVRGFDLPTNVAYELLASEYNPRCDPPWSRKEIDHKIASADRDSTRPRGYKLDDPRRERQRAPYQAAPTGDGDLVSESFEAAPSPSGPKPDPAWQERLLYSGGERPSILGVAANAITILRNHPKWAGVLAFDEFKQTIVCVRRPPWDDDDGAPTVAAGAVWTDADTVRAGAWLVRHHRLKLGRETVRDAVSVVAESNIIHPLRDEVDAFKWDGVSRVDSWVSTYLGANANDYNNQVGKWFLISAIARLYDPGCKVDTMPVLEGDQGLRKSSALRALFGSAYFSDTPIDFESKDRFVSLLGAWCLEIPELDGFGRADVNRIKGYLSSPADTYRPPYGRGLVRVLRRCVFAGTVNPLVDYFRDETGNRRFWPIVCGTIDIAAITRDRSLLWAEAREMYRGGEKWWPSSSKETDLCVEEQVQRATTDAWTTVIAEYLDSRPPLATITIADVMKDVLGLDRGRWGQSEQTRVAKAMKALGWEKAQRRLGEIRVWVYRRKEKA